MWSQEQSSVQYKDTQLSCVHIYIKTQARFVQAQNKPSGWKRASETSWLLPAPDRSAPARAWFRSAPAAAMSDGLERIQPNSWAFWSESAKPLKVALKVTKRRTLWHYVSA